MNAALANEAPEAAAGAGDRPSLPADMAAIKAPRYGSPDVVELTRLPRPTPGKGEVVVEVAVAGLSRGALHLLTGSPYLLRLAGFGLRRPKNPVGTELAGTVVEVGPDTTRLKAGDEVFGYGLGTCAEFAVAKEDKLAIKPPELSFAQAAATVDSASTALQAVRDHAEVRAGQRVLVLGASGGVGTFAVQIAAAFGAEVTGTASAAKLDFVRSLGATNVIDHHAADPLATGPYDVILDLGGNRPVKQMREALTPEGTLVIVGGEGGNNLTGGISRQLLAPMKSKRSTQNVKTVMAKEHHRYMDDLGAMVVAGKITPAIDQTHNLANTKVALERMANGTIKGKDVVTVA